MDEQGSDVPMHRNRALSCVQIDVVVALHRRLIADVADRDLPKDSLRKRWPVKMGDLLPLAGHGLGFVFVSMQP